MMIKPYGIMQRILHSTRILKILDQMYETIQNEVAELCVVSDNEFNAFRTQWQPV